MAEFPKDRFDDIPRNLHRVGAHRAPARPGRGWVSFAWAALATGVLVLAGMVGLSALNGTGPFDLPIFASEETAVPEPDPQETMPPVTDPAAVDPELDLTITVLNGSPTDGLQDAVGDLLAQQKWPVGARSNAAERNVEETLVYYNAREYEGIARGVLQAIGSDGEAVFSDVYLGAPVTVVLGADYTLPG